MALSRPWNTSTSWNVGGHFGVKASGGNMTHVDHTLTIHDHTILTSHLRGTGEIQLCQETQETQGEDFGRRVWSWQRSPEDVVGKFRGLEMFLLIVLILIHLHKKKVEYPFQKSHSMDMLRASSGRVFWVCWSWMLGPDVVSEKVRVNYDLPTQPFFMQMAGFGSSWIWAPKSPLTEIYWTSRHSDHETWNMRCTRVCAVCWTEDIFGKHGTWRGQLPCKSWYGDLFWCTVFFQETVQNRHYYSEMKFTQKRSASC